VDPAFQSDSDGMEYPTLFTGRSRWLTRPDVQMPEMTTSHETGHQWWYAMVASNEFEHAWMDEGINTYATARVLDEVFRRNRVEQRYFGTFIPWSFRDIPFTRHPTPANFFQVVNEVSGQDLTPFFDQVYRSSNTFDYAVQELKSDRRDDGPYRTVVVVQRLGEAMLPVDVVTTFADGQQVKERWSGLDRRRIYVYERASRATSAEIDPQRALLLDANYTNNSRTLEPRSGEASTKWALTWMVWLQDLMVTYAFFV
jgi:hypothetical protein